MARLARVGKAGSMKGFAAVGKSSILNDDTLLEAGKYRPHGIEDAFAFRGDPVCSSNFLRVFIN